ncbi:MAG: vWA domain-containing protein [Clostridia bacterium]
MEKNITELVFILDRSGSMAGLESDTIGGYNSMLVKQKLEAGLAVATTVLFDDNFELLHDRINIQGVAPITEKEYFVRGTTALLDAIGKTIQKIGNAQKHTSAELRADKVMIVIITDGMENASKEYSHGKIKKLIAEQKEKYAWEFIFLGANIDAIATAAEFGIDADKAADYQADAEGTILNFKALNNLVSEYRLNKSIDASWKNEIEEDFIKRGGKGKQ